MNLTFWNVDRLLGAVDLGEEKPMIDLASVNFFEPFALVYLGMYLRRFNRLGRGFEVRPPNANDARKYLARVRFWERFNFRPEVVERENLIRFTSSTSLNDMVDIEQTPTIGDDVAESVLRVLRAEQVAVNTALVAELVGELVDNFAQHSETTLAACAMQYYPRKGQVTFAIGDCGIGIRASLSSNPRYAYLQSASHAEAALKAFDPLVSRRGEGGTGLTGVQEGIITARGRLVLATGDGYVKIDGRRIQIGTMALDLPGVQIEMMFPEVQGT